MADLVVELYGTRVGALSGMWRTFVPDPAAVARFGIDSPRLTDHGRPAKERPCRDHSPRHARAPSEARPSDPTHGTHVHAEAR